MRKARLTDAILEEAARMVVEEDFQEQNEKAMKAPHIFSPEFHEKMNRVFASADAFTVHNQSDAESKDEPFLQQLDHKRKNHSPWSYRRYIAIVALLMLGVSGAALASDDIREGLRQLRLQFFSDNVTIKPSPESVTEQGDADSASEEFHTYKWKEVPEGYQEANEYQDNTVKFYTITYGNDNGNYIYYSQSNTENSQHYISYDSQEGYKRIIELYDGLEAYSISDGRNNTIFYEKDGYLFEFMSDQPEEVILDYIDMSGVLDYEY